MNFNTLLILAISASLSVTSVYGVKATDIFASAVNADTSIKGGGSVVGERDNILIGTTIESPVLDCENPGETTVNCGVTGTGRTLAPDITWPVISSTVHPVIVINGDSGTSTVNGVETILTPPFTINPGTYTSIDVSKGPSGLGSLTMNPGIYWVDDFRVSSADAQVIPGTDSGTVLLLVKSNIQFANSSLTNCTLAASPYSTPNRFSFYTEDLSPEFGSACISAYMYFKTGAFNLTSEVWGSISAESFQIQNGGVIHTDTGNVLFTDFQGFLETGPKQAAGWHIVAAPAEINATNPVTVQDFFANDFNQSTFREDWRVYKRDYDEITHSVFYTELDELTDPLEKSRGYWIGAKKDANMTVLGLKPVVWEYDIPGCTSVDGCYRYTLTSCSTGDQFSYLYNLVGYPGAAKADWADYRVEVDGNGTFMTPTQANAANIINNQIWYYTSVVQDPQQNQVLSGAYTACNDQDIPAPCDNPDYFQGQWVEVNCTNSIGKTIDLIIPNSK